MINGSSKRRADCLINARHQRLGCRGAATFDARALTMEGFLAV